MGFVNTWQVNGRQFYKWAGSVGHLRFSIDNCQSEIGAEIFEVIAFSRCVKLHDVQNHGNRAFQDIKPRRLSRLNLSFAFLRPTKEWNKLEKKEI